MPVNFTYLILIIFMIFAQASKAVTYPLPVDGSRLVGKSVVHHVGKGDYFQAIAEKYNVGFLALMAANPGIDPFLPPANSSLVIPSQLLLPYLNNYQGIVINLPELRLFYFHPDSKAVSVFPIGIGKHELPTPRTVSYISEKTINPIWRPSLAMRERYLAQHGVELAKEIPPGKNNPFGKYALRLGQSEYLIHGSNQRFGIGMRASSGCIRMYDADIEWLYENVGLQTPVRVIDQPVKMSYEPNGARLIELHRPLANNAKQQEDIFVTDVIKRFIGDDKARWQAITPEINQPKGLVIKLLMH